MFSVSLHPVCYKISKEGDCCGRFHFLSVLRSFAGSLPDGEILFGYTDGVGLWHSKGKAGGRRSFLWRDKRWLKELRLTSVFVQDGLITGPAQNEVTYKGDVYVFDGQNNIRAKTRYAMDQQLKGMMSWDLATDMPLNDSRSLFKTMVEELGR